MAIKSSDRQTTTIRVSVEARDRLQERATKERRSVGDVLDAMIWQVEEDRYWEEMRSAVDRLRADPVAWAEYQAEIELWDSTSGDGLADDEDWGVDWNDPS